MINFSEISTWSNDFGYSPILLQVKNSTSTYLLKNGAFGDFCINLNNENLDYHSIAWSSNVNVFLVVKDNTIAVFDWTSKTEKEVSIEILSANFKAFYKSLNAKATPTKLNVVSFFTTIFNELRTITQEQTDPVLALNNLLLLLLSIEYDIDELDQKLWNISTKNIPSNFADYKQQLKVVHGFIQPNLDLILNHALSEILQETQKEITYFDVQRDLFGGISNDLGTKSDNVIHHSPSYLTRSICNQTLQNFDLNKKHISILDPVCNSGEQILELLNQLESKGYNGKVSVTAFDALETSVIAARFLLNYKQQHYWKNKIDYSVTTVEDALTKKWAFNYDIILLNAPFASWDAQTLDQREALKSILAHNFKGQPNLSSAYFFKAVKHLNENGVIGAIIPSSFLTLDAYKNLRDEIYLRVSLKLIAQFGNYIFDNPHANVSVFIGKSEQTFEFPKLIWTKNEKGVAEKAMYGLSRVQNNNETMVDEDDYSIYEPNAFPILNENWQPIALKDYQFLDQLNSFISKNKLIRLEELFDVKQGIRQGAKNIFKISAAQFRRLPEHEKQYFRPVIDNDAIKNGTIYQKHFIWYPYDKSGILFKTEEELIEKVNYYYSIVLKPNKTLLEKRGGITEWWGLSRPRHWQFEPQPTLFSTEFGKSDSFGFDPSGNYISERGNSWIPNIVFDESDFYFYLALFSSSFFNKLLAIYGKELLSGWDLGKKSTKNIPIPSVENVAIKNTNAYLKLVEIGKSLSKGNTKPKLKIILDAILLDAFYPKIGNN